MIFIEALMNTCDINSGDNLFFVFKIRSILLAATYGASQELNPAWSPPLPVTNWALPCSSTVFLVIAAISCFMVPALATPST